VILPMMTACAALDNKIFDRLPGMEGGGTEPPGEPPLHHNCRCIIVPVLEGMRDDPSQTQVNYQDWFDRQDNATKLDILGPSRYREYLDRESIAHFSFIKDGRIKTLKELKIDRLTRIELIKKEIFDGETIKELVKITGELPSYFDKVSENDWQKILEIIRNNETGNIGKVIITENGIVNGKGGIIIPKNILTAIDERINKYDIADDAVIKLFQNEHNKIYNKLTEGEEGQKNAIDRYSNNLYAEINETLFNNTWGKNPQIKNSVGQIDSIMDIARVPQNVQVFRGTAANYYNDWEVGSNYEVPLYFSTSLKYEVIEDFLVDFVVDNNEMIIEILVPKNTRGFYLGDNVHGNSEFELILDRNTIYKVLEKTDNFMKLQVVL